jgi:hypothetical protein
MTDFKSEFLSQRELKALLKIGDIMIPENDPFPLFSRSGCISHVDVAVGNLDPGDLSDLKLFFKIMSIMPSFIIKIILRLMKSLPIGLLRLGNLGIRGIVFTLYYSSKTTPDYKNKRIHQIIGYNVKKVPKGS